MPAIRTTEELLRSLLRRVKLLERRIAVRGGRSTPTRGSTALRDSTYGVPATAAEQAALANAKVLWWNADTQWEESYYAPQGTVGLTARALVAGTPAGWYPTGEGPVSRLYAAAAQTMSAGTYVTSWALWGVGESTRRGGSDWFTYAASTGTVTCVKAGNYEVSAMTTQQVGSGTTVTHILRSAQNIVANPNNLNAAQVTTAALYQPEVSTMGGQSFSVFSSVGSYQLNITPGQTEARGFFHVRYKGPRLVSD